jgi:hypothetical protein
MTNHSSALDLHLQQQCVAIAIGLARNQTQAVARAFALGPEFVPRSAEERHISALQGTLHRSTIHESHHQDFPIGGVLHDGGYEATHLVEVEFPTHWFLLPTNKKPAERFRVSGLNL